MVAVPQILVSPKLNIAILGMGGIGSALAFQLTQVGGHTVTAIARPQSLRFTDIQEKAGIVNVNRECASVIVAERLDENIAYDVVIVTIQAHRVATVLPALQKCKARCILFMFNNFDPDCLQAALGAGRCSFGMPFLQAFLTPDGLLNATIGAGGQKSKLNNRMLVDIFNAAGLPAMFDSNMLLWLRCHVPLCIAFESISVAAVRRGAGATWTEAMTISRGVKEIFVLIQALGYEIYPSSKGLLGQSPAWFIAALLFTVSRIRSFRELLAMGAEECAALVDALLANSARASCTVRIERIRAMRP